MKIKLLIALNTLLFFLTPKLTYTQVIDLGSASSYSVFSAAGAFSNDGATHITGDIGTNVGAFTGFPPGTVVGQINVANSASASAATDVANAYAALSGKTCGMVLGTTMGSGQILTPNIYCLGAASTLNGTLTLNGQGNANSVFIFKIDGALATGSAANIVLTNSANLCNVYWQISGAFELGTNSSFQGTVLAGGAITLNIGSSLSGRALTTAGAINLHTTNVSGISPPNASISASGSTMLCEGASVTLTATSANSYSWSNGAITRSITVSTAGSYSVTVSDACGTATSTPTMVTIGSNPTASISAGGPVTFCQGGSVTLTASGGGTYLWSTGATTTSIVVNASGNYTVTATNAAGCTGTSAATAVTVNPNPNATISAGGPTTFCQGENVVLTASVGSAYLWSTGATTQSITTASSGNYSVTVTNASGCSTASGSTPVTVNPLTIPVITANGPTTFCPGGSVILTSSIPSGILWSNGATTQNIEVTSAGSYTVTDQSTCGSTSATTMISVSAGAIPTISAGGPLTFCTGGSVILTSSPADGYLWSTGATTQSITVSTAGNYSVTTTGTCSGTSLPTGVSVMAVSVPTISASGPTSICTGGNVILTSSLATSYLWSTGATTQSITVTAAGNYSVTNTGTCGGTSAATMVNLITPLIPTISANGPLTFCTGGSVILTSSTADRYLWSTGATTQSITVNQDGDYSVTTTGVCAASSAPVHITINDSANPTISSNGPLLFCLGDSVILTSSISSGYLWSTGATTQSITVKATGSYSVTTSGICAGTSSATTVAILPATNPTITASGPLTFCQGDSIELTSSDGISFLWSTGETTQSVTVKAAGSYSVTTSGACGGISAATIVVVNASAIPTITASGPLSFCLGDSVTLTSSTASHYTWSTGDTTQIITIKVAGNYTVTTPGLCAGVSMPAIVSLNSFLAPTITASGPLNLCIGDSVKLTASLAPGYLWSTSDTTRTITVRDSGIYSVFIPGACSDTSLPVIVSLNSTNSIATISANGPTTFCVGERVILTASKGSQYFWSFGAKSQSVIIRNNGTYWVTITNECGTKTSASIKTVVNPIPDCTIIATSPLCEVVGTRLCATGDDASYLWSNGDTTQCITLVQAGTYSVIVTNPSGCSSTCSKTIIPSQFPDCTITGDTAICFMQTIILSAPVGDFTYLWNNGATTQNLAIWDAGIYTVVVTNPYGCVSTCSKKITVSSQSCMIAGKLNICGTETTELKGPMDATSYLWSNGSTSGWITVTVPGTYSLTATNAYGCENHCSVIVTSQGCIDCLPGYSNFTSNPTALAQPNLRSRNLSTIPNNEENLALSAGNLTVQAYPNPFVNSTIIHFSSPVRQHVIVEIYNLRGQKVASLFDGTISRNEQRQVQFDASNLVDGVYFYRMTEGKYSISKKLILSKK